MYNDNKKVHAIKFQTVVASNGLITILFCLGRHDSGLLGDSGLLHELQQHAFILMEIYSVFMVIQPIPSDNNLWVF